MNAQQPLAKHLAWNPQHLYLRLLWPSVKIFERNDPLKRWRQTLDLNVEPRNLLWHLAVGVGAAVRALHTLLGERELRRPASSLVDVPAGPPVHQGFDRVVRGAS